MIIAGDDEGALVAVGGEVDVRWLWGLMAVLSALVNSPVLWCLKTARGEGRRRSQLAYTWQGGGSPVLPALTELLWDTKCIVLASLRFR